jgi:anti-sigma B factor antagonist
VGPSANHEQAACVKEFLTGRFELGWRRFVIDLEGCRGIDSTFIGMLSRLAVKIANSGEEGGVEIINPSPRNAGSIQKLGLERYLSLDLEGSRWRRERELVDENLRKPSCDGPIDQVEHAEFVLAAHEALIAANEENCGRFRDVVDFLRQELEAHAAKR